MSNELTIETKTELEEAYKKLESNEDLNTDELKRMIDDLKSDKEYYSKQYDKYFSEAIKYKNAFNALVEKLLSK